MNPKGGHGAHEEGGHGAHEGSLQCKTRRPVDLMRRVFVACYLIGGGINHTSVL